MKRKIVIIIIILLLAGGLLWFFYPNIKSKIQNKDSKESDTVETTNKITLNNKTENITSGGTYHITGSLENGNITVNATEKVKLVLENVTIKNSGRAISISNTSDTYIELKGENTIESTGTEDDKSAIFSNNNIILEGEGALNIKSNLDAIRADNELTFNSGTYIINADDNAIRADAKASINGGKYTINAAEGIESTYVKINDGDISIKASDDGINASDKSTKYDITLEINGGTINIEMAQGDTDALDSNGNLYINGGTLNITAQSPFDYDGESKFTGGTITVNGEKVTTITNQMMGGPQGGNMPGNIR